MIGCSRRCYRLHSEGSTPEYHDFNVDHDDNGDDHDIDNDIKSISLVA